MFGIQNLDVEVNLDFDIKVEYLEISKIHVGMSDTISEKTCSSLQNLEFSGY